MENQEMNNVPETETKAAEMLTIKFSRKLAKPFTTKGGKEMVAISIPNVDPDDKRSWEAFVLPNTMVHSDHYGSKSIWTKLPVDGKTVLSRSVPTENGGWGKEERTVDNTTLKGMVEAYKLKPRNQEAR